MVSRTCGRSTVQSTRSAAAAPPPVTETLAGTVQLPEDVKVKLKEPLPREAVSPNPQKPGLSVIKVIYVVERLNEVFGLNGWHVDNEVVETGRMVVVRATLSIPRYAIAIEQFGGNDNPDRGDAYKGACTDALSKCASYLGIGMDVYKGLYEQPGAGPPDGASSATRAPAPTARSTQNGAQSSGAPPTGLTSRNMASRFSSLRTVLGAREYSEILGRHGFREVTGIPSLEKAREVYRVLLDAFRIRFGETRKALGSSRVHEDPAGTAFASEGEAEPRPSGAGLQSHGGNSQCQTVTTGPGAAVAEITAPTELARALTLFQIEESLALLAESAEEEGLTPEIEAALTAYLEGAVEKRDRVAEFIHFCEAMAELAKAEVKRLQARQKHFEATAERVSSMVLRVLDWLRVTKLEGRTNTLKKRKCPPSVNVIDEQKIPPNISA